MGWDAHGKSMTFAADVQCSHQRGPSLRPATDLHLQAKTTVKTGQGSRPDLGDVDSGIPHQGPVGEYPEIPSKPASERFAPGGFALFMGAPPVVVIPGFLRPPIPVVERLPR